MVGRCRSDPTARGDLDPEDFFFFFVFFVPPLSSTGRPLWVWVFFFPKASSGLQRKELLNVYHNLPGGM